MLFFYVYDEKYEVIAEKPFQNSGVYQALVAFSARHSSRTKHLSYSFDLQSCLHKYKRHACWVCCNALEKFAVKFARN